ncbi:NADH dehydrogenase [ubiquinone] iron-sulfur protein 5 [Carettochelys insculpta]|uniref:NADH dehydrogenase [ubiquinone] iron-sulfur protein 5 n=1 Tax=Carettochelys insculpta TaxID=44489 RepID=UPI003EBD7ACF
MPFLDLQDKLGINADKWMLLQSSEQPFKQPTLCQVFEKEWVECASGIGQTRARKECRLEYEDFQECLTRKKMIKRLNAILAQRKKLIKEGQYTPPEHQRGKEEVRP